MKALKRIFTLPQRQYLSWRRSNQLHMIRSGQDNLKTDNPIEQDARSSANIHLNLKSDCPSDTQVTLSFPAPTQIALNRIRPREAPTVYPR
jgi:hypothetical protein